MNKDFDIQTYMTRGVERIVSDALRATLKDPKESAFMLKFARAIGNSSPKSCSSPSRGMKKAQADALRREEGFPHQLARRCGTLPVFPYSDVNVGDTSLRDALRSELFAALQEKGVLSDDHNGGCVLYEKKDQVEALLADSIQAKETPRASF